jgi:hypothetical protein
MAILRVWMDCRNKATHGLRPVMMRSSHDFGSAMASVYIMTAGHWCVGNVGFLVPNSDETA